MKTQRFYEIRSRKSENSSAGIRQISFACEGSPDLFAFLWVDAEGILVHAQLLYDEVALEWSQTQGVTCSRTNRTLEPVSGRGIRKGARSLHVTHDPGLLEEALNRLRNSIFPAPWHEAIREKFQP